MQQFHLKDRKGEQHAYSTGQLLRASVSMDLVYEYQAILSARVMAVLMGGGLDQDASLLADEVSSALRELSKKPELIRRLFRNVTRDGRPLADDIAFDAAYSGNWDELHMAVAKLLLINGIIPFSDTIAEMLNSASSMDLKGILASLNPAQEPQSSPQTPAPTT